MIDTSKYRAHKHPGKFKGETAATEYFYEQSMEGDGEEIYEEEGTYYATMSHLRAKASRLADCKL